MSAKGLSYLGASSARRPCMSAKGFSYLRLSSARQLDGDGLKRQLELSEAYALANGIELDTTLRDLGVSAFDGSNRVNGALSKFLDMVKLGQIAPGSFLLVESLDRLSRDHVVDALEPFLAIVRAGINLITLADNRVYSRETINSNWTELIISLSVMARAHEESATKSHRLSKAWVAKRQDTTRKLTGRCPAWLKLKPCRTEFELITERVAIVQRVFEELAEGIGRDKIASRLNIDGVKPWGHGRQWHGGTVQVLTTNRAVIGQFQPHRLEKTVMPNGNRKTVRVPVGEPIPDYFPRAISDELCVRAQASVLSRIVLELA